MFARIPSLWPLDQQHIFLALLSLFSPSFFSVLGRNGVNIPKPTIQVFTKGVWTMTYTSSLPHMSTVRNAHTHASPSPVQLSLAFCSAQTAVDLLETRTYRSLASIQRAYITGELPFNETTSHSCMCGLQR